jgi:hypothetical protein
MHAGSLYHGDIIAAFERNVPGCYVRDYRDNGGYITICRNYRDIPWRDQLSTRNVYRQVPATTLASLPRGYVTAQTIYRGFALVRPGWREEFRKAMRSLTEVQMRRVTKALGARELFPGVVV